MSTIVKRATKGIPLTVAELDANFENLNIDKVESNTKDASNGFAGLTLFKLNLKNVAGTVISWFTTSAVAPRTWTMPDKDGTVAMLSDAVLKDSSTGAGSLPVGTSAQRPSLAQGLFRFNTTLNAFEGCNGSIWGSIGGGAKGGGTDDVFYENSQTITTSYTLTAGKNAMSAGPITINDGATVTVPNGAAWVVV